MKVFITIPWFAPAYRAGGPIQSIANLVANFNQNIKYYIFCSNVDLNAQINAGVPFNEWVAYNSYTNVWYDTGLGTKDNFIQQNKILKPQVIFIIGLFSWRYNILPLLYGNAPKKILSVRGMLHPGALSQKKFKKKLYISLFRLLNLKKLVIFHATDAIEKEFVQNIFGNNSNICIAGNYVKSITYQEPLYKISGALKLITVALISPMKNHLLILQALQNCIYNIEYTIIGPIKDTNYWALCLQQIALLPPHIKVHYIAEVLPHFIHAELANAHLFIMPSKSENFGHSLVEALQAGKPIITSHNTMWQYLDKHQAGININTTATEILNAINFYADMDNTDYLSHVNGAYNYIAARYSTATLQQQYNAMFYLN